MVSDGNAKNFTIGVIRSSIIHRKPRWSLKTVTTDESVDTTLPTRNETGTRRISRSLIYFPGENIKIYQP